MYTGGHIKGARLSYICGRIHKFYKHLNLYMFIIDSWYKNAKRLTQTCVYTEPAFWILWAQLVDVSRSWCLDQHYRHVYWHGKLVQEVGSDFIWGQINLAIRTVLLLPPPECPPVSGLEASLGLSEANWSKWTIIIERSVETWLVLGHTRTHSWAYTPSGCPRDRQQSLRCPRTFFKQRQGECWERASNLRTNTFDMVTYMALPYVRKKMLRKQDTLLPREKACHYIILW